MSEPEYQRRASELARLWQGQVVSVEDEATTTLQRARVVPSIEGAIRRAAAGRRKDRRLRKVVAVLSVAAAVLCVFGIGRYLTHRSHAAAVAARDAASGVRALSGTVTLVNAAGPTTISQASIEVGDALSTAADGRAELKLSDLVVAELDGSSELSMVTPTASAHRVRLDRGHLHAKVNDRPSAAPKLVVETPNVDVVVTGTVFQVDVTPGRNAREFVTVVSVTKGRVVVRHGAQVLAAVAAGQTWSSSPAVTAVRETDVDARIGGAPALNATRSSAHKLITPAPRSARPGTLAEENELFQNAVDARNGGDDRAEADRLAALLNRYPRSQLAGEARVERMRALQRSGQASDAAREARRYLAEYPEGYARDEARRIVMQDGASSRSAP
jgi:hypothetical protein